MPRQIVAETNLEKEFEALCKEHSPKLNKLWENLKEISERVGIPFGPYVPASFKDGDYSRGNVPSDLIVKLTGADASSTFWYSSSADC